MIQEEKKAILDAMRKAERKPKPTVDNLFTDVYKEMPPSLVKQRDELLEHMAKYPDAYTI
jgi:2-oxoisovalerate dehydrogenase E1 component alpha subunit